MAPTPIPPLWREGLLGLELAALLRDPVFRGEGVRDGGGQPVMLIPGFLAGDDSLRLMARWLKATGHRPSRAGIRMNVACSGTAIEGLEERLEALVSERGMRAAVIGHSRGGTFARVLAHRRPDLVSGIVMLGTAQSDPLAVHPLVGMQIRAIATLGRLGVPGLFSHACLESDCCTGFWEAFRAPPRRGVGYVSVYSRTDGIVRWEACVDPATESVEVASTHCGMAAHPEVFRVVAESLEDFRRRDARRRPLRRGGSPALRAAA